MSPVKFKSIKPGAYKEKAMLDLLSESIKELGELIVQDFELVTEGWQGERPHWKSVYRAGANFVQVTVEPVEKESEGALKWLWLDEGTPPHAINPKPDNKRGLLFFMSEYTAGSTPGVTRTSPGESGGFLVAARGVMHPGIEPRHWTQDLQDEWQPEFEIWAQDLMEDIAEVSGHGRN
jgi:hypothetical protein